MKTPVDLWARKKQRVKHRDERRIWGEIKSLQIAYLECLYFTCFALRCGKGTEELPGQNSISFPGQRVVNLAAIERRGERGAGSI